MARASYQRSLVSTRCLAQVHRPPKSFSCGQRYFSLNKTLDFYTYIYICWLFQLPGVDNPYVLMASISSCFPVAPRRGRAPARAHGRRETRRARHSQPPTADRAGGKAKRLGSLVLGECDSRITAQVAVATHGRCNPLLHQGQRYAMTYSLPGCLGLTMLKIRVFQKWPCLLNPERCPKPL